MKIKYPSLVNLLLQLCARAIIVVVILYTLGTELNWAPDMWIINLVMFYWMLFPAYEFYQKLKEAKKK